jgi:hypothetical protein
MKHPQPVLALMNVLVAQKRYVVPIWFDRYLS